MREGVTSGLAASWITTSSVSTRSRARCTDSARVSPPATTSTVGFSPSTVENPPLGDRRVAEATSRTCPSTPGGAATTIAPTDSARARASTDQATSGLPPTSTSAFGPPAPRRSPEPAAATIAVAICAPLGGGGGAEALLQELVEVGLGSVLVLLEGVHELGGEDLLRPGVHLLLAGREALLPLADREVAHDLGELEHVAGLDLLAVVLEAAVSVFWGVRHLARPDGGDAAGLFLRCCPPPTPAVGGLPPRHPPHLG